MEALNGEKKHIQYIHSTAISIMLTTLMEHRARCRCQIAKKRKKKEETANQFVMIGLNSLVLINRSAGHSARNMTGHQGADYRDGVL